MICVSSYNKMNSIYALSAKAVFFIFLGVLATELTFLDILAKRKCDGVITESQVFLQQRNFMSRQLNLKIQQKGQMECENGAKQGRAISGTGGWCPNSNKHKHGSHRTDVKLVDALSDFFKDKYIGGFGDGPGNYKQLFLQAGTITGYDAFDGAPFCETRTKGLVKFLDLSVPQYGLPLYDWILSLEVAEHIPKEFESVFIDNIVRHAREGVVISWAKLGQEGYGHVNNRPFEYVKELIEKFGFVHNNAESQTLKNATSFSNLKRNVNVFRRKQLLSTGDMTMYT